MNHITVLGMDPGKTNYAWSVVQLKIDNPSKYRILGCGMIQNTISSMTGNTKEDVRKFVAEVRKLLRQYGADVIGAERFQARGLKGNTSELVNVMIGCLFFVPVKGVTLLTASTWKNAFNRVADLKQTYEQSALTPHQIDATSIGLYTGALYLNSKPFQFNMKLYKKRLEEFATNEQRTKFERRKKLRRSRS